jgi:hypothetical protein
MHYIGQKVLCVNGEFDASIVEWADAVPVEGKEYTVRNIILALDHGSGAEGLAYHLLEFNNPKTSSGGEVGFSISRFIPVEDEVLEAVVEENDAALRKEDQQNGVGEMTAFFGSRNNNGILCMDDIEFIVIKLIESGCLIRCMEKMKGSFRGQAEEMLRVRIYYTSFPRMLSWIQFLRRKLKQEAVGLENSSGVYVRLTEDTLLCQGVTCILYKPSIKVKEGKLFDPEKYGFVEHKDYLVYTNQSEDSQRIERLRKALVSCLDAWDDFSYSPGDDVSAGHPRWIASGVFISSDVFMVWHPNEEITASGGVYVQAGC